MITDEERNKWSHPNEYAGNLSKLLGAGLFIGTGNAIWALVKYMGGERNSEHLLAGVEAVFGSATQEYFLFWLFLLLGFIPIFPFLLKLLTTIHETLVFGLGFLYSNLVMFSVAAMIDEGSWQPHLKNVGQSSIVFGLIIAGFLVSPYLAVLLNDDFINSKKGKRGKDFWILYSLWLASALFMIWFTIRTIQ